jgi:5-formyltetrahydrofolate cyclo-ligase
MFMTTTVDDAKRALAVRARAARRAAGSEAAEAAEAVCGYFLHGLETGFATGPDGIIAGYWPLPDELDVRPLLAALDGLGRTCSLPVTAGVDGILAFRRWRAGDELVSGAYGVSEPGPGAALVTPALVITPLLAVDSAGYRLGYGAGYYDRTLALLRRAGRVEAVGVGFAAQIVDHVPHDGADQRLDWVITEHGAIQVGA